MQRIDSSGVFSRFLSVYLADLPTTMKKRSVLCFLDHNCATMVATEETSYFGKILFSVVFVFDHSCAFVHLIN